MILLDKPFVSEFLAETIEQNDYPVVGTEVARELGFDGQSYLISEELAVRKAQSASHPLLYTPSENAIGWIGRNLAFTGLPEKIDLFKDKAKFRELIRPIYPDFYFRAVQLEALRELSPSDMPMPFIIKPCVGFFSMGVHRVSDPADWDRTVTAIESEIREVSHLYPVEVMNTASFIIEQCIEGEEFAFDAYFDAEGQPVILNILQHIFSSDIDVSDRVYISSKEIIEDNLEEFTGFLRKIGELSEVRNFPVHVEVRRDAGGALFPIEINPMRFGGWCSTADLAGFAYGFNPYEYYFGQERPDWTKLLKDKEGKLYSLVVLDNSTGVDGSRITSFDYSRLLERFEKPLELRKIDHREYPVFGFVFTETRKENFSELEDILKSDLKEFITIGA